MATVRLSALPAPSQVPTLVAGSTIAVAAAVLVGWDQSSPYLTEATSGAATMQPGAALGFLSLGVALLLCSAGRARVWARIPALILATSTFVVAALTLVQYASGLNLGIDQLPFMNAPDVRLTDAPGRIAVATAICLVALSAAIGLYWSPSRRAWALAETFVYLTLPIALLALLGHAYEIPESTRFELGTAMAIHTALLVLLLGAGILGLDPRSRLIHRLLSRGPGGTIARTLLPVITVGLPALGWLRLDGARAGYYGLEFGVAFAVSSTVAILWALVLWSSAGVDRHAAALQEGVDTLRASEQRFRSLAVEPAQMIWITDAQGQVTGPVPAWQAYTGQSDDEVLGFRWADAVHPDDLPPIREAWQRALTSESPFAVEGRLRRHDGVYRWCASRCVPILDPDGVIQEWVGSITDIDDRRRVQEELRESDERLNMALKSAGVGTWSWDMLAGRIVWDDYLHPLFGLAPGTFPGHYVAFANLIHSADRERVAAEVQAAVDGTGDFASEYRVVWPDATNHVLRSRGKVHRDSSGRAIRMTGVSWDATEERTLSAQLRQAQKMEAVGRLAGGIAHDFNNLLTAISGQSELLLEDLPPDDSSREPVEQIFKASVRAAGLTAQLLAFSRQQVLEPRLLDLNALIADLEKMLERLLGEDVALTTRFAADLGTVKADPGQVEQVIMNLAVNARDAMPKGGRLMLETANVELGDAYASRHLPTQLGHFVMLAVTDTGLGMEESVKAHLFEPFYTTKEAGKGTGLGLSTAYGIVKQSGGFVWAYSEPGQGATFKVYLPRADGVAAPVAPEERWKAMPRGTETLLVAEDDDAVRGLIEEVLKRCGYHVLSARRGTEALELASRTDNIELLITDVVMPEMSGRELATTLQAAHDDLRVLFMSGYTDDAVVRHGIFEGSSAFLQKPFSGLALAQKVRALMDER